MQSVRAVGETCMLGHSDTGGPERCQACQPWPVAGEVAPTRPVGLPPARSACHLAAPGLVPPAHAGARGSAMRFGVRVPARAGRQAMGGPGASPRQPVVRPRITAEPHAKPGTTGQAAIPQERCTNHRQTGDHKGGKPAQTSGPQQNHRPNLRTTGKPPANLRTTAARTHHQRPADVGPRGTKTSPSAGNPGRHGTENAAASPYRHGLETPWTTRAPERGWWPR
jgi:hypothetical protein